MKAVYINRSDISWYSKNANVYRKALEMVTKYDATLCLDAACRVPPEIESQARQIVRFAGVRGLLKLSRTLSLDASDQIFTGFDFPCLFAAWRLKRKFGCKWTMFLWDPPALSHRDNSALLRWCIDLVWRWFARRADKLVLNIHPGLLNEIGYIPPRGQELEYRLQDAFEEMIKPVRPADFITSESDKIGLTCFINSDTNFAYDFGILSNWSLAKGGPLFASAITHLPNTTAIWIGDHPSNFKPQTSNIKLTGRFPQSEAFNILKNCRVLVVPYLPVPSLKWNYALKLFEYLQLGRPILASDNPGNAAIAAKFPGRITLYKSGDLDDLIAKMKEMLK